MKDFYAKCTFVITRLEFIHFTGTCIIPNLLFLVYLLFFVSFIAVERFWNITSPNQILGLLRYSHVRVHVEVRQYFGKKKKHKRHNGCLSALSSFNSKLCFSLRKAPTVWRCNSAFLDTLSSTCFPRSLGLFTPYNAHCNFPLECVTKLGGLINNPRKWRTRAC